MNGMYLFSLSPKNVLDQPLLIYVCPFLLRQERKLEWRVEGLSRFQRQLTLNLASHALVVGRPLSQVTAKGAKLREGVYVCSRSRCFLYLVSVSLSHSPGMAVAAPVTVGPSPPGALRASLVSNGASGFTSTEEQLHTGGHYWHLKRLYSLCM